MVVVELKFTVVACAAVANEKATPPTASAESALTKPVFII